MKNIKSFFKKILNLEYEMTDKEQLIYSIFTKLLDHQETNKVLYNYSSSYLSNSKMDTDVAINGNEVLIKSGNEVMSIICCERFMVLLSKLVNGSVERNVNNLYKKMMENQNMSLKRIDDTMTDKS